MIAATLEADVRRVIAQTFGLSSEEASGDVRMSNPPAWDSLGHMDLVAALEKEFDVRFPVYALAELTSVSAIAKQLERMQ
jgi:acyl carrier protein